MSDFGTAAEAVACKAALRIGATRKLCLDHCRIYEYELRKQGDSQGSPLRSPFREGRYKQKLCVCEVSPRGWETAGTTDTMGLYQHRTQHGSFSECPARGA